MATGDDMVAPLRSLVTDLERYGISYALVGGSAVSARTRSGFNGDIRLAGSVVDDAAAEAVVTCSTSAGYSPAGMLERPATGHLDTMRLSHRRDPNVIIALHLASFGIEREIVVAAEPIEPFPELVLPVATVGHLIAIRLLERDDRQPPTESDLRSLADVASPEDWDAARFAATLITERGYNRGRGLAGALDDLTAIQEDGAAARHDAGETI